MEYLSISQTAEKWGISTRRIQVNCKFKFQFAKVKVDFKKSSQK